MARCHGSKSVMSELSCGCHNRIWSTWHLSFESRVALSSLGWNILTFWLEIYSKSCLSEAVQLFDLENNSIKISSVTFELMNVNVLVTGWTLSLRHPHHLILCNFSKRAGSRCNRYVYFIVKVFKLSQICIYYSGVPLKNCGGHWNAQNSKFYVILLYTKSEHQIIIKPKMWPF